ncbi:MAG: hypothetical protein HC814_06155 [Rhodobacteraceae bacterium]|nr:hypothetical protein [Paracoccaceae bacterium]
MTATINPGNTPIKLRSPFVRMRHYVMSLLMWIREGPFDNIVFVESSNHEDLSPLHTVVKSSNRKVEFISFEGSLETQERGKGFGEAEATAKAFSESKILKRSWDIWKVTGRLYVPNAAKLKEVHKDQRHVITSDTRYYKISQNFYWCHLHHLRDVIDDRRSEGFIESVYGHAIAPMNGNYRTHFKEPIEYIGQGGGSGKWYGQFPDWVVEEAQRIMGPEELQA